jgi:hypothetical protein
VWRNPIEETFIKNTNDLFAGFVEPEILVGEEIGIVVEIEVDACISCEAILKIGENYFPGENAVLRCALCCSPPVQLKIVDVEKKCQKCGISVTSNNCSKSQFKHSKPKCFQCVIAPLPPAQTKLSKMIEENERRLDMIKKYIDCVFIDFEHVPGDESRITQCGIVSFSRCCGKIKVVNYLIAENQEEATNSISNTNVRLGRNELIPQFDLCSKVIDAVRRHEYVGFYSCASDLRILEDMKISPGKYIDVQLLVGDTKGKMPSLQVMLDMFEFPFSDLHCAANDAYWSMILYFCLLRLRKEKFVSEYKPWEFSQLFYKFLDSDCCERDFVDFQYDLEFCWQHEVYHDDQDSFDKVKYLEGLPRRKVFELTMSHLLGQDYPDRLAALVLDLV